ncbi:MAG: DNA-directed RNA polymerase subunit H [Candidatus Bathyarchaeota archaeon]|nr:DNA-directed RNA polymerase subunit H [Candidatus Bathyarchaeota archaeon]
MGGVETLEEKRAALLIKHRNLKVDRVEREAEKITFYLSRGGKRYIMLCIIGQKTIGIAYVRELRELMDGEEADKGIMIGDGRYTYSARSNSGKMDIELIPSTLPTFDVFQHEYVPRHEVLTEEERREVLERFHAEPYQFPWIKASDPIAIILGAEPGDIIRIVGESVTAGRSESYRYVAK